jgi:hypothetical protein
VSLLGFGHGAAILQRVTALRRWPLEWLGCSSRCAFGSPWRTRHGPVPSQRLLGVELVSWTCTLLHFIKPIFHAMSHWR